MSLMSAVLALPTMVPERALTLPLNQLRDLRQASQSLWSSALSAMS